MEAGLAEGAGEVMTERMCPSTALIRNHTYICGRPAGHERGTELKEPDWHQAIAQHDDGDTYIVNWTTPRVMALSETPR
jgi:hypothetical protein